MREQKLLERKKQASELLRWKQDLDAEEEKVLQLERTALQAWEGRVSDKPPTRGAAAGGGGGEKKDRDARREETEKKGEAVKNWWHLQGCRLLSVCPNSGAQWLGALSIWDLLLECP